MIGRSAHDHVLGMRCRSLNLKVSKCQGEGRPPRRHSFAGLVDGLPFTARGSGFCVLRVKAREQRDLITVVGHEAEDRATGPGEEIC
jgi:hypothetical protein